MQFTMSVYLEKIFIFTNVTTDFPIFSFKETVNYNLDVINNLKQIFNILTPIFYVENGDNALVQSPINVMVHIFNAVSGTVTTLRGGNGNFTSLRDIK